MTYTSLRQWGVSNLTHIPAALFDQLASLLTKVTVSGSGLLHE